MFYHLTNQVTNGSKYIDTTFNFQSSHIFIGSNHFQNNKIINFCLMTPAEAPLPLVTIVYIPCQLAAVGP